MRPPVLPDTAPCGFFGHLFPEMEMGPLSEPRSGKEGADKRLRSSRKTRWEVLTSPVLVRGEVCPGTRQGSFSSPETEPGPLAQLGVRPALDIFVAFKVLGTLRRSWLVSPPQGHSLEMGQGVRPPTASRKGCGGPFSLGVLGFSP